MAPLAVERPYWPRLLLMNARLTSSLSRWGQYLGYSVCLFNSIGDVGTNVKIDVFPSL